MTQELEIVIADDKTPRIDSRLVAKSLGIEHKHFLETVRTYSKELNELGQLPFQTAVGYRVQGGGNPTKYALLNEDQSIFAATLSRNTRQVVEFKLKLTKAFSEARKRLMAQENGITIHRLTDKFRPRALENINRVPNGYFSVMGELFKHLYNLEAIINRSLDEDAMIEISVGLRWSRYAREVLGIPDEHRCKYAHICQRGRIEHVWAYALENVTAFDKWLWGVYFPQHFPEYERYRARYIAVRPSPKLLPKSSKGQALLAQQAELFPPIP